MIANADSDVYYYQDGIASKGVYEIDGEKHYFSYETGIMQKESADGYIIEDGTVIYEPTSPLLSSDLFGAYYERATEIMNTMTLEEKVGQLFLICFCRDFYKLTGILCTSSKQSLSIADFGR